MVDFKRIGPAAPQPTTTPSTPAAPAPTTPAPVSTAPTASASVNVGVEVSVKLEIDLKLNLDLLVDQVDFGDLGSTGLGGGDGLGELSDLAELSVLSALLESPTPTLPPVSPRCLPMPPPEKALSTDPSGFPKGSVRTAGGYTIVPEGKDAAWSVYAPGQKMGEKPMTRVWGDPHVDEKDGTRWDFTKNSNFRLPDGTTITCDTTSQKGQSVSKTLNITNGANHVTISGLDHNKPVTSAMSYDGFTYRAKNLSSREDFVLGKNDGKTVQWFKADPSGSIQGLITGSHQDGEKTYHQNLAKLDAQGKPFEVDPALLPPMGSAAWARLMDNEIADAVNQFFPELAKDDDKKGERLEKFQHAGGLRRGFMDHRLADAWRAIRMMGDLINQLNSLTRKN